MSRQPRAAGITPSMVDVSAKLPDETFAKCLTILDAEPGDWRSVESSDQADELLSVIAGTESADVGTLCSKDGVTVVAGSTILGMLTAMPPTIRQHSSLISAVAHQEGELDPLASIFSNGVRAAGLHHEGHAAEGRNPLGFVLSSINNSEKVLAMHAGVGADLQETSLDEGAQRNCLVIIDAYELRAGKIGAYLEKLLSSREHRVALSLGNRTILNGDLRDRIRRHIANGALTAICGNEEEFQALYPELDTSMTSVEGFREHPLRDAVPFILLTRGENGLSTSWDGEHADAPAHPLHPSKLVNTSGAGDTSAGVFYGGILTGAEPTDTLRKAAYLATHVLQVPGSSIIAEK